MADVERGAAAVDFVLVTVLLVPLVMGIVQVGLVLHVRNTTTAAASEGARTAARLGASPDDGIRQTRSMIRRALTDRHGDRVTATETTVGGVPMTVVTVSTRVDALGPFGPAVSLTVRGRSVSELAP